MLVTTADNRIAYVIPQTEAHLPSRLHAHRNLYKFLEARTWVGSEFDVSYSIHLADML
jgi:hypothetical protein